MRTRGGEITLYTSVATVYAGTPRGLGRVSLSPAPSSTMEDPQLRGTDLATLRQTVLDDGSGWDKFPLLGLVAKRSVFRPNVARFGVRRRGLESARGLAFENGGRWRLYDLGTDLSCSRAWPDDLIADCHAWY